MIQAKILKTEQELADLLPAWSALLERNPATNWPFHSWQWYEASLRGFASAASRYVVVLEEQDQVVAILPLVWRKTRKYGVTVGELNFCPNFNTPRNDLLTGGPQHECRAARTALDAILADRQSWHMLRLDALPRDSELSRLLTHRKPCPDCRVIHSPGWQSPCVEIARYESFDHYQAEVVNKHYRTKLRRDLRRLDECGQAWSVEYLQTPHEIARGLEELLHVRSASWKGEPTEGFACFFQEISPYLAQRRELLIALLRVGGCPVAAQYLIGKDGEYYMILNDHDHRYHDAITPGTNLLTLLLHEAFQRKWKVLCFSGIDYEYKKRLANATRSHETFEVFHSGLKSQATWLGKTRVLPLVRKALGGFVFS